MAFEELMELTNRLLTKAQALAAMTARLRLDELGLDGDPGRAGTARPGRRRTRRVRPLRRARRARAVGIGVLRPLVGTGVAGLAIAFCTTFPEATVVGLDPWEPALAIAEENVASAGLEPRVTLLATPVQEFHDPDGFDLVWLPSFFIPEPVLGEAIDRIFAVTRPDGSLVVGMPDGSDDDPLAAAVDDLVSVRSGGSVVDTEDAIARLDRAGFTNTREIERAWDAPLRLIVGRRA